MKTKLTIVFLLIVSLLSVSGCSKTDATSDTKKKDNKKDADTTDISTNNWDDYTIEIKGKKLTMPFKAKELLDLGLALKFDDDKNINPLSVESIKLLGIGVKEQASMYINVVNNSEEILPIEECTVIYMSLSTDYDVNENVFDIFDARFIKGLTGNSSYDEFIKALSPTESQTVVVTENGKELKAIELKPENSNKTATTKYPDSRYYFEFKDEKPSYFSIKLGDYDYTKAEEYKANK